MLHLGDITTPETVALFRGLPITFLRGNNDDAAELAPALSRAGMPPLHDEWTAEVEGVRIGATHGHMKGRLAALLGDRDVVLHGHTHRRRVEQAARALVVNPGALHRAHVRTIAILEVPSRRVLFFEVRESGVVPFR